MNKGLLNSMVLKKMFKDVDGDELLPLLIKSGVITKEQVEEYYNTNIKLEEKETPIHSQIIEGVLVKFDARDANKKGEYTTPKGVHTIGKEAFYNCFDLRKIHLGRDVIEIQDGAFGWCRNLETVTMTNSVRKIGSHVFIACSCLTDIKLSNNIKVIPEYAFANCTELQSIRLPENVQAIESLAFRNCKKLHIIGSPSENLLLVDEDAFDGTPIQKDFMRQYKRNKREQNQ